MIHKIQTHEFEAKERARKLAVFPELVKLLKEINYAFYVDGTSRALKPVMAKTKDLIKKAETQLSEDDFICPECGHTAETGACFHCKMD